MKREGKLIVLEGLDGSGKSTQTTFLVHRLRKEGYKTEQIDFPQYGEKSAGLIEEYLRGKYGASKEVGAYRASVFYACDRYDASFKIREWLAQGRMVVADRYVISNIGHQGGKILNKKKWEAYIRWLYNLEYEIFGIPRPDITLILKSPPEIAGLLAPSVSDKEKRRKILAYLGQEGRDIHERDLNHQRDALRSYLRLAKLHPKECKVIECVRQGELLPRDAIHIKIWEKLAENGIIKR